MKIKAKIKGNSEPKYFECIGFVFASDDRNTGPNWLDITVVCPATGKERIIAFVDVESVEILC